jgi:hypothetical protein
MTRGTPNTSAFARGLVSRIDHSNMSGKGATQPLRVLRLIAKRGAIQARVGSLGRKRQRGAVAPATKELGGDKFPTLGEGRSGAILGAASVRKCSNAATSCWIQRRTKYELSRKNLAARYLPPHAAAPRHLADATLDSRVSCGGGAQPSHRQLHG